MKNLHDTHIRADTLPTTTPPTLPLHTPLFLHTALAKTQVSFFEWVQNLQNFKWDEEDVNRRLDRKMTDAFHKIWAIHKDKGVPLRVAAFIKALQEVTRAEIHRGFD